MLFDLTIIAHFFKSKRGKSIDKTGVKKKTVQFFAVILYNVESDCGKNSPNDKKSE